MDDLVRIATVKARECPCNALMHDMPILFEMASINSFRTFPVPDLRK